MRAACILAAIATSLAAVAAAESVVATRTIRAQEIVSPDAVRLDATSVAGAFSALDAVIGKEARVAIYPGRPIMRGTLGSPALIERNQVVELIFARSGLRIVTEGRALARGGEGERIRVMNLASRAVLFGRVRADGSVGVTE